MLKHVTESGIDGLASAIGVLMTIAIGLVPSEARQVFGSIWQTIVEAIGTGD